MTASKFFAYVKGAAAALGVAAALAAAAAPRAHASSPETIHAGVETTLTELFVLYPDAESLYNKATAVLVFPNIVKGGFIIGGAYGEGALLIANEIDGYWAFGAGSIGFQAGAHSFRRVVFFMTAAALNHFIANDGANIAADAELTILERGTDLSLDSTTETAPIIVVNFGQRGLIGGASIRGGKYDPIVYK